MSAPVTTPAPATGDPSRDLSRLARGGALNLAGSVAYGLLNFVLVIIVTRGLGKDASGVFFEAVALFVIASNTAELGADTGLVRFIARYRTLDRVHDIRWTLVVALVPVAIAGTALALIGLYYAEPLSRLFGSGKDAHALVPYVHMLVLFLPLSAINTVAIAGTRGFGTMIPSVTVDRTFKPLGQCVMALAAVAFSAGSAAFALAYGLPIGLSFVAAVTWLLVLERRSERRMHGREVTPPRRLFSEFWRFTAPRGLAGVFQVMILWLDTLLIGALRSSGEAAVYTASSRYIVIGQAILQAMVQAIAPQISSLLAAREHDRAESVYQAATTWLMIMSWPIYLTMAIFAPVLVLVFGASFTTGGPVLVILSLAMLVSMACGPVDVVLLMGGKSWWSAANTIIALVLNVILNLLLIPPFGITGSAVAWFVSILVRNILPLIQVSRFLGLTPFGPGSRAAALASVPIFGGIGLACRFVLGPTLLSMFVFAITSCSLYALVLWRLRDTLQLRELVSSLRPKAGRVEPLA
ncbi:MAG: lipopolysaccharide biosynthesis protein [Actinomycetota bacterium]